MLHTMQVRIVTRQSQFHPHPIVHKAYYFCPSLLGSQGVGDIEEYITKVIEKDIEKFKEEFVEFKRATFTILLEQHTPTAYIG